MILNRSNFAVVVLAAAMLLTSCSSSTIINSVPSEADLFINGEYVGKTPYKHKDTKIVGSVNEVRIEKEGFQVFHTSFAKDEKIAVGPVIGGIFFCFLTYGLWNIKKVVFMN